MMTYLIPRSYKLLLLLCCCVSAFSQEIPANTIQVKSSGKFTITRTAPTPPPPPVDVQLFFHNGDDSPVLTNWASPSGITITTNSFMELSKELRKETSADSVMLDNQNLGKFCVAWDEYRSSNPVSNLDRIFVAEDLVGNVAVSCRHENDHDLFCKIPGMTQNAGRGFFLGTLANNTSKYLELCYTVGTGSNASLEMRVDGVNTVNSVPLTFTTGTGISNIKKIMFRDGNDNVANPYWFRDRIEIHNLNFPNRGPLAPPPPPPPSGTDVTSYGLVCDNSTINVNALNNAIADRANWVNNTLIFPANQTCIVNAKHSIPNLTGFTILGNGATIKAANGLSCNTGTAFFLMTNTNGFVWDNLNIDGNRANRCVQEHSAGDNLRLLNVNNATFVLSSINATNDGLSVRATVPSNPATHSRDLTFTNSKFSNAYRNNISVIEGHNIRFLGTCSPGPGGNWFLGTCTCQMTNANGTDPQTGIDWEPNSGSSTESITDGLVDGCLLANNARKAYSEVNGQVQNNTLRNSIIRGNGHEITIWGFGGLYENNYFTLDETIGRFAWLDFRAHTSIATALNPARIAKFNNNFLNGVPLLGSVSLARRIVAYGNCNPPSVKCGPGGGVSGNGDNSTVFQNNIITNSGILANGDWCNAGPTGNEIPGTIGNILDGILQVPNPGCS